MKPLDFVAPAARRAFKEFPEEIQDIFGFALFEVQTGKRPSIAKTYHGPIEELRETDEHNLTYLAVYIATFEQCVYVLHAFVKKSTAGGSTSKHDRALIDERYAEAKRRHAEFVKV